MVVKLMHAFEKGVILVLAAMMVVVIVLATVNLASVIIQDIMAHPFHLIDTGNVLHLLGVLIVVVIAVELLDTATIYFDKNAVKIEVVYQIAMMALAREVIILDLHETPGISMLGIAAIAIALSLGYFLVRRYAKPGRKAILPEPEEVETVGPVH